MLDGFPTARSWQTPEQVNYMTTLEHVLLHDETLQDPRGGVEGFTISVLVCAVLDIWHTRIFPPAAAEFIDHCRRQRARVAVAEEQIEALIEVQENAQAIFEEIEF